MTSTGMCATSGTRQSGPGLRSQLMRADSPFAEQPESSLYTGEHYIECHGSFVATDRHRVAIS
jgi:hypothetical protein